MSELTKTRSPWWRSTMAGAKAATRRCAPRRFTSMVRAKSFGDVPRAVPGSAFPALDTTMSSGPTASWAARAKSSTEAASARSSRRAWASPPAARICAATASHFSTRRAPSTTGWPTAARAMAVAAPIPDDAPATTEPRRSGWATKADLGMGTCVRSARGDGGGEVGETPHVDGMDASGPVGVDVVVGHPGHELLQHDAGLEPGQGGTQAEVAPPAEADELGRVPVEIVGVGLREHLRVPVGRSHQEQHALAVTEDGAEKLDRARGDPHEHLRGRVVAQGLLDPVGGAPGVGQGFGLLVGEAPCPVPGVGQE